MLLSWVVCNTAQHWLGKFLPIFNSIFFFLLVNATTTLWLDVGAEKGASDEKIFAGIEKKITSAILNNKDGIVVKGFPKNRKQAERVRFVADFFFNYHFKFC